MSIFSTPDFSFKRDRVLESKEISIEATPIEHPVLQATKDVFDTIELVQKKADILLSSIQQALVSLSVPVRDRDTEVAAAVQRKDPSSSGKFITFDLYLRSLEYEDRSTAFTLNDLNELIGIPHVDGRALRELILAKGSGLSKDDARLSNSQAMYLYTLQLMQQGLQAIEAEKQTSTKTTVVAFGTEIAPLTLSMIQSLAFQLAYSAAEQQDILDILKECAGNGSKPSAVDLTAAAASASTLTFPNSRVLNLALTSKEPADFDIIKTYAFNFVRTTKKIGYEPWLLAEEVLHINQSMKRASSQSVRYENAPLHKDIADVFNNRSSKYSSTLDSIATALRDHYDPKEIACSLNFLLSTNSDPISFMNALIQMLIRQIMNAIPPFYTVQPVLEYKLAEEIMCKLGDLIQRVNGKLLGWFQTDPDLWEIITRCTPVSDLVNASIEAMQVLESIFYNIVQAVVNQTRDILALCTTKCVSVVELARLRNISAQIAGDIDQYNETGTIDLGQNDTLFATKQINSSFIAANKSLENSSSNFEGITGINVPWNAGSDIPSQKTTDLPIQKTTTISGNKTTNL